jgi:excisionase family DNA binding protein
MNQIKNATDVAPVLLTVVGAARMLGIGRTTIYDLIARGQLDVVHIGRAARIPVASVDRFVDDLRGRQAASQEALAAREREH